METVEINEESVQVTLSTGEVVVLGVLDFSNQQDQMVWVCDQLGLSVDAPLVEKVTNILDDMEDELVNSGKK